MSKCKVKTEAVCTWPGDSVTIIQTIDHPQKEGIQHTYIGLSIADTDLLIKDLMKAKQQAIDWDESYDGYCDDKMAQEEKRND